MKDCFVYNGAKCLCKDGVCLDSECGCKSFLPNEELKQFKNRIAELSNSHGISEEHAGCYLCNFEEAFICKEYNGGCKSFDVCQEINHGK